MMTRQNIETAAAERNFDDQVATQSEAAAETQPFSLGDTTTFAEIEQQANQLLDYISKLSSLTDRACDTALRESEFAQQSEDTRQVEVSNLKSQLKTTTAALEEQRHRTDRLEKTLREQLAESENRLLEQDAQINDKDTELKHLRAEITCLLNRLKDAEETVKHTENAVQQRIEPLNEEISALKSQLAQRDETIQLRNNALRKIEVNHRASMTQLEQNLREMESQIQKQESLLKEREAVIQATAGKEAEIGKLIRRLSTECQNLSLELQEKTRLLNEVDAKKPQSETEGKSWRRVIGRLQEEGV